MHTPMVFDGRRQFPILEIYQARKQEGLKHFQPDYSCGNKDTHDERYGRIKYRNDRINFLSRRDEALLLVNRNDYTQQRVL
jgi:hypothetical protein